ncbi:MULTISPECIES: HAD family hydrolase [Hydrogenophaga]|uniref:Haloacid dehalogenase n=1 Tax=Hydrogenophaga electricum TaxID=1230953 RepID=A0ABQ6C4K5_9BURK|nr:MULTISPECIES: HAD family hydrolase [Hydrogenophaga]GLS15223.1 haloacid dehalogenase [Hydrogenophaga electricum]
MKLALFDLDHTLLPLDSDYAWGDFVVTLGWRAAEAQTHANDYFYEQYKAGTLDIHEYIRFSVDALREHGVAAADAAHRRFMQEVIGPAIRPAARELVQRHQAAGDQVIIVTATNEFVTRPIAQAFGVSELIAIDLERDAAGNPTGAIRGTPSFREGKVARVEQWLAARGLDWSRVEHSTFYSDSINDLPLLDKVHEPVATNPDARLTAIAAERGWRILNLFE